MDKQFTKIIILTLIVFVFFAHTLNYSWKFFDEDIIYAQSIWPIAHSLFELMEIIKSFGLNQLFESSSVIYSNIAIMRGTPVSNLVTLITLYLFKDSAFCFHLLMLVLHIANTVLCFLILNKVNTTKNYLNFILTLIWAFHPVNVESILLATNFGALLTYFISLLIFFLVISNKKHPVIVFFLFLFVVFFNEYAVTLPLILFFYLLANNVQNKKELFKRILPLVIVLVIYTIFSFLSSTVKIPLKEDLIITLERIFWLSPQIFMHFIKLVFFPVNLSIDQTAFVKISHSLFSPYAVFCFLVLCLFTLFSVISLFNLKRNICRYYLILFMPFFLSLLPFLHIISPIYNLASERYLYFPLFFIVLGLVTILSNKIHFKTLTITFFSLILILFGIKTYSRTLDWQNSRTFLISAIKSAPNNLYKGLRELMLATSIKEIEKSPDTNEINTLSNKSVTNLNIALDKFQEEISNKKYPLVLRFYGLDPTTLEAKTAFLIGLKELQINDNPQKAYEIFFPYYKNLKTIDALILNFYYKVLFRTQRIDKAEELLKRYVFEERKISPIAFVALSDLCEFKYNDLAKTEKYLLKSFKYFPYDTFTLFGLKRLYKIKNEYKKYADFSYLYGLRTHDLDSLNEAKTIYMILNKNHGK